MLRIAPNKSKARYSKYCFQSIWAYLSRLTALNGWRNITDFRWKFGNHLNRLKRNYKLNISGEIFLSSKIIFLYIYYLNKINGSQIFILKHYYIVSRLEPSDGIKRRSFNESHYISLPFQISLKPKFRGVILWIPPNRPDITIISLITQGHTLHRASEQHTD